MIHNTFALIVFLLFVEILVFYISNHPISKKYFRFFPSVFWIYFLPMLASLTGLIDSKSQIYQIISANLLPASLILLLLSSDIKSILRLERPALIMMLTGTLGIMLGFPLVFILFKGWVGLDMWSGFGALSASWTGGSANMIAVKEAIGTPDNIFMPMVVVDTVVPYVWMSILIAMVNLQPLYDKWNKSDRRVLNELGYKFSEISFDRTRGFDLKHTVVILLIAVFGIIVSYFLANKLPIIKDVISVYAWVIIIVSSLGILLSFTRLRKLEEFGASKIGYFILYFVLASIGARTNISNINSALILIVAGFLIIIFHALVLFFTSRIIKAPMFLIAVASQANIGGVASAPIVAAIYQPGLASVGLLLAILGNIIGTYCGIITAQLCHFFAK